MIDIQSTAKPPAIFEGKKPLTKGQEELMKLISLKIRLEEKIIKTDIIPMYQKYVQRNEKFSSWRYDHNAPLEKRGDGTVHKKTVYYEENYEDWEISMRASDWLLRALGALIKKGYLTVILLIDLAEVKPCTALKQ